MKKKSIYITLLISIFIFGGCNSKNNTSNSPNYQVNKTSANSNNTNNTILNTNENNSDTTNTQNSASSNTSAPSPTPTPEQTPSPEVSPSEEQVLSEFSTQIKSKSSNRLNNIKITCDTLNNTTLNPEQEFSFCNVIGKSTEEKGYKKADVIMNKKIIQALGGGNCQVSTTLYNAVLSIPELKVTERHPHGKKVNYVPEGKDAAISHGSKDFKFINNTGKTIKIYANSENNLVNIKIVSL